VNALCLPPGKGDIRGVSEPGRETGDPQIVLGVLTSIERDSAITQRKLAGDLGIALGLANSYLRRCVRKGLIKVSQVPLNRYAYYLTPQGFAEKGRLTAEYLSVSFNFFRRARGDCVALLQQCRERGWRRVAFYGAGELAEIAILSAGEASIEVVCVIDPDETGRRCAGLPVVADLTAARLAAGDAGLDGVILTDTLAPQSRFEELLASAPQHGMPACCILAPSLLAVSRVPISAPPDANAAREAAR
jgi:DNA-binding MarR family transcriptional regulator